MNISEEYLDWEWELDEVRYLSAAEGYVTLGMFEEANEELDQIHPRHLFRTEALVLKLCVHAGLEEWDLVRQVAGTMAQHDPRNPQWSIWWATATCRAQSVEAAKQILLEALRQHPNNANIHYNLSCYETRLHHFRTAQRYLARAIQLDPRFKVLALDDKDLELLWMGADA